MGFEQVMRALSKIKCGGALLLSVCLAGCVSLTPPYTAPEVKLPEQYRYQPAVQSNEATAQIAWQDYFVDPQLQALIEQALRDNHDIRMTALRIQQARAALRIERSARLPGIAVQAEGTRSRMPGGVSATGSTMTGNEFRAGVGLNTWELDFWGRIASLNEAALQEFLATRAAHQAMRVSLVAQVADAWLNLRELEQRLHLAQASEANRRESVRLVTRRVEVGTATRLELTQAQTLLHQAQSLALDLQQQREVQGNALNLLVGRVEAPQTDTTMQPHQALIAPLAAGQPSELLMNRPDLIAAEHRLRTAHAQIGAARAAFFPRITLTVFGGAASSELNELFKGASRAWRFMPSVSLPIFDGGWNRAHLDLAQLRKEQAIVEYEHAIQSAFRDVADALAHQHWLQQQHAVQQQSVVVQDERRRLARLVHARGRTGFLDVLDAERDALDAQQQQVQVEYALLHSRVALYAALGGGFSTTEQE